MVYTLDRTDLRILYELNKNSRIPDTKLAKLLKKSKESIRYRIKRLRAENILNGFTIWVDPIKLGYTTRKIYLSLSNVPTLKEEFKKFVIKDNRLFWLGFADGAWDAGLTYFVKNNKEFYDIKNELLSKFNELITEVHTAEVVEIKKKPCTFLFKEDCQYITLLDVVKTEIIDELDIKIINALFKDARTTLVELARLSETTIDILRNRIKKLISKRIIVDYNALIDFEKIGYNFFKSFLYFKKINKQDELKLLEYCRVQQNIIYVLKQISPWDIELEIFCKSYQEYNLLINNLKKEFSDIIRKVDTAIINENYVFPAGEIKIYY